MTIDAAITHLTTYHYDRPVAMAPQIVRLRPAPHCRTRILSYSQTISPADHFLNWQQDPFGNWLARIIFPDRVEHFSVTIDLVARMDAINPFDFFLEDHAETVPFSYSAGLARDLAPYLECTEGGPCFDAFVRATDLTPKRTVDFLVALNQRVQQAVGYVIRMEPGIQTPEETLEKAKGSCRDSAWLLVQVLRRLGYAARFVSGYLIQLAPDVKPVDGPAGPSADFTDLHAWAEVYAPGAGWIGLDATSGLFAGEGHIPLAATPFPQGAAPISGAHDKAEVSFDFAMEVRRVHETPRITLPYTDDQWDRISDTGYVIDRMLKKDDVRLTVGGEPTFVSASDRDGAEWNIEAVGPTKRAFADRLIRRLRDRFAPKGLLHYGQGKWYPGEQLPRWAFALYWRRDGESLWEDDSLIAREDVQGTATAADAEAFMVTLCEALEVDPSHAQPAYEDTGAFLLKEHQLPLNVTTDDNRLDDPQERARLARVFDTGLGEPASFVLPIQPAQARAPRDKRREGPRRRRFAWQSERWRTRREALFLIPGDSPAGLRLPLQSLTVLPPEDVSAVHPLDPFAARGALPTRAPRLQDQVNGRARGRPQPPAYGGQTLGASPAWGPGAPTVRTALAVEPRGGRICVFMPPVPSAEEYVDLIQAIEETAIRLDMPVHVEGYTPPSDERLEVIKVTPDPGVVEVNIHPSRSWEEQVAITDILYEEARQCGLDTSKFEVNGRPSGSGGGNHIVMGGATPVDSPFLRRPDLLASLIRYWQNHPSLSYFFSGQFIGATSQAPRIDEARHETLSELELAFRQIPDPASATGGECPPWLVDRLFRHLLVDVSGNTHRSEICIDKLYSPDGPTGRLGLVEFRAFEMPPHARMSLTQQLLLRALIARFWRQPYTAPLIRFGTMLQDKYMLPYFLWKDLVEVLSDTGAALGVALDPAWFNVHYEWRFPHYGSVTHGGVEVSLRAALEPWPVLGEEGGVGGTVRFVDSSLERLQVNLKGDAGGRYRVTCNGIGLPLTPTDHPDTAIAGVRFRTWLPSSCLHPTIPPHGPLVFDVVDTWNGRSIGGCTYHAEHPGGLNPDTRPINALEAEGRMLARFSPYGHTPGPMPIREPHIGPDNRYTLDLRWHS